jgi:hypothetical protein
MSFQARGNNNHGTSFSTIAKNIKINFFPCAGPAALIKHFEEFFLDTSSSVSL